MTAVDHSAEHVPIAEDGWTLIHSAIRLDLSDTSGVVDRLIAADKVEDWEWESLRIWWVHGVSAWLVIHACPPRVIT